MFGGLWQTVHKWDVLGIDYAAPDKKEALKFVLIVGIVSLFTGFTYEWERSFTAASWNISDVAMVNSGDR